MFKPSAVRSRTCTCCGKQARVSPLQTVFSSLANFSWTDTTSLWWRNTSARPRTSSSWWICWETRAGTSSLKRFTSSRWVRKETFTVWVQALTFNFILFFLNIRIIYLLFIVSNLMYPHWPGVRGKPQQDSACDGHTAEEPGQTGGVPEPLPDGPIGGRAVLWREELSDKTNPGPQEGGGTRGGLKGNWKQMGTAGLFRFKKTKKKKLQYIEIFSFFSHFVSFVMWMLGGKGVNSIQQPEGATRTVV